jgi:hypothetical protein
MNEEPNEMNEQLREQLRDRNKAWSEALWPKENDDQQEEEQ